MTSTHRLQIGQIYTIASCCYYPPIIYEIENDHLVLHNRFERWDWWTNLTPKDKRKILFLYYKTEYKRKNIIFDKRKLKIKEQFHFFLYNNSSIAISQTDIYKLQRVKQKNISNHKC